MIEDQGIRDAKDMQRLEAKGKGTRERVRETRRSAEVLGVFAKHNFYAGGFTPYEMRTTLEDLGPTYVKIGQIMSSRTDMLPQAYCDELSKLRSNVAPLSAEDVRAVIEQETGKPVGESFAEFVEEPLGSASIAQAHRAALADGTRVVVKVQRPGIAETCMKDFQLLKKLASYANTASEDDGSGVVDLLTVVEELERVTAEELDFRVEATNTREFREKCIENDNIVSCPVIIDELTSKRMLTMTLVDGFSLADGTRIDAEGCDREKMAGALAENYLHQILDVGLFHADPHQGNIMVSAGVPYWIDFGMVGRVAEREIDALMGIVTSLLRKDSEGLADAALSLVRTPAGLDRGRFVDGVDALVARYATARGMADLDVGAMMSDLTDLMTAHDLTLPGEYTMLVRGLVTVEGVVEELAPDFDLLGFMAERMLAKMKERLDLQAEAAETLEGMGSAAVRAAQVPMLAYDALHALVRGKTKVNVGLSGYESIFDGFRDIVANVVLAIFACVLFSGACALVGTGIGPQVGDMPVISALGFVFAFSLGIYSVKHLVVPKR